MECHLSNTLKVYFYNRDLTDLDSQKVKWIRAIHRHSRKNIKINYFVRKKGPTSIRCSSWNLITASLLDLSNILSILSKTSTFKLSFLTAIELDRLAAKSDPFTGRFFRFGFFHSFSGTRLTASDFFALSDWVRLRKFSRNSVAFWSEHLLVSKSQTFDLQVEQTLSCSGEVSMMRKYEGLIHNTRK